VLLLAGKSLEKFLWSTSSQVVSGPNFQLLTTSGEQLVLSHHPEQHLTQPPSISDQQQPAVDEQRVWEGGREEHPFYYSSGSGYRPSVHLPAVQGQQV